MSDNKQTIEELNKFFIDKDKEFNDYKNNVLPELLEKTLREMVLDSKDINISVNTSLSSSIDVRITQTNRKESSLSYYNYQKWGLTIIIDFSRQESGPKIDRNSGLPSNEDELDFERILISDAIKETGWMSAFKMVKQNLYNLKEQRSQAQFKYLDRVDKKEKDEYEAKKEKFYSVVKPGYVIPKSIYESYVIQKVAIKNVHVIHFKDKGQTRKRAIKKNEFFNKVSKYVDLTEV